ncbi:hypothetical protein Lser_V15G40176 [Lactuca serriola]
MEEERGKEEEAQIKLEEEHEIEKLQSLIWISSSPASPSNEGSVTLKNISLSRASLALLKEAKSI